MNRGGYKHYLADIKLVTAIAIAVFLIVFALSLSQIKTVTEIEHLRASLENSLKSSHPQTYSELIANQSYYLGWIAAHGTSLESKLFAVVDLFILNFYYFAKIDSSVFSAFIQGILKLVFVSIISFRAILFTVITLLGFSLIALKKKEGDDFVSILSRGSFFKTDLSLSQTEKLSGFRSLIGTSLSKTTLTVDSLGAVEDSLRAFAIQSETSRSLARIIDCYQAAKAFNPPPEEQKLFSEAFSDESLSNYTVELLGAVLQMHSFFQAGQFEIPNTKNIQFEKPARLNADLYSKAVQLSCSKALSLNAKRELAKIRPELFAACILALAAAQAVPTTKELVLLRGAAGLTLEFSALEQELLFDALSLSSSEEVLNRSVCEKNISQTLGSLIQILLIVRALPHQLLMISEISELWGRRYQLDNLWSNELTESALILAADPKARVAVTEDGRLLLPVDLLLTLLKRVLSINDAEALIDLKRKTDAKARLYQLQEGSSLELSRTQDRLPISHNLSLSGLDDVLWQAVQIGLETYGWFAVSDRLTAQELIARHSLRINQPVVLISGDVLARRWGESWIDRFQLVVQNDELEISEMKEQ